MSKTSDQDAQEHLLRINLLKASGPLQVYEAQQAEVERLKDDLQAIRLQRDEHVANNSALYARVQELDELRQEWKRDYYKVEQERDNLQQRVEELGAQIIQIGRTSDQFAGMYGQAKKERDELRTELERVNGCLRDAHSDEVRQAREIQELRLRLAEVTNERDECDREAKEKHTQIRRLELRLTRQERDSTDQIEHLKDVSTKRKFEIEDLKARLAELQPPAPTTFESFDQFLSTYFPKDARRRKWENATPEEVGVLIVEEAVAKAKAPHVVKQTWQPVMHSPKAKAVEYLARNPEWFDSDCGLLGFIRRDYYPDGSVIAVLESIQETEK